MYIHTHIVSDVNELQTKELNYAYYVQNIYHLIKLYRIIHIYFWVKGKHIQEILLLNCIL